MNTNIHPNTRIIIITGRYVTGLPFSSEVNPEAASTFSSILLSFITFVAQTYPCLPQIVSYKLVKEPHFLPWQELFFVSHYQWQYIFLHAPSCLHKKKKGIVDKQLLLYLQYLKKRIWACIKKIGNVPTKFRLTCAEGWLSQYVTALGSLCNIPHQSLNVVSAELCQAQNWTRTSWEKKKTVL